MEIPHLIAVLGFCLAAYSIVGNDAIQTLGTFLSSNSNRPWWVLWLFACSILVTVIVTGWVINGGDVAWGRLERFPMPEGGVTWLHVIPPLCLLFLTRAGVPVSTTFLVLTVFAPANLSKMLVKSLSGYALAFVVGLVAYRMVSRSIESRFLASADRPPSRIWVVLQWLSTGFLWSQWLIQDLANIFVYVPRQLPPSGLVGAVLLMLALHAIIFYRSGGAIQKIVTSKTNTRDIRSATIIDFIYGWILLFFKELSNIPMSTTWVFLGLLAGRELAMTLTLRHRDRAETGRLVVRDASRAFAGLAVSVILAFGLPIVHARLRPGVPEGPEDPTTASAPGPPAPSRSLHGTPSATDPSQRCPLGGRVQATARARAGRTMSRLPFPRSHSAYAHCSGVSISSE
jgi:hypothetical protein